MAKYVELLLYVVIGAVIGNMIFNLLVSITRGGKKWG